MNTYYFGILTFKLNNTVPKDIMDSFIDQVTKSKDLVDRAKEASKNHLPILNIHDGNNVKPDIAIKYFDIIGEDYSEDNIGYLEEKLDDYSIHTIYFIMISFFTDKFVEYNCEDYINETIDLLRPYAHKKLIDKPIGTIKFEGNDYKEYYWNEK